MTRKGSLAKTADAVSDNSIPTSPRSVNKQFSVSERTLEQKKEIIAQARRYASGEISEDEFFNHDITQKLRDTAQPVAVGRLSKSFTLGNGISDNNISESASLSTLLLKKLRNQKYATPYRKRPRHILRERRVLS